ncbi:MAG: hypothetical protein AVDCRST_MAG24-1805, partial [uncultured Nocardioidaceae bacterium]
EVRHRSLPLVDLARRSGAGLGGRRRRGPLPAPGPCSLRARRGGALAQGSASSRSARGRCGPCRSDDPCGDLRAGPRADPRRPPAGRPLGL